MSKRAQGIQVDCSATSSINFVTLQLLRVSCASSFFESKSERLIARSTCRLAPQSLLLSLAHKTSIFFCRCSCHGNANLVGSRLIKSSAQWDGLWRQSRCCLSQQLALLILVASAIIFATRKGSAQKIDSRVEPKASAEALGKKPSPS